MECDILKCFVLSTGIKSCHCFRVPFKILDVDPRNITLLPRSKKSIIRLLKSLPFKLMSSKYGVTQRHPENILPSCLTGSGPKEVQRLFVVVDGSGPLENHAWSRLEK